MEPVKEIFDAAMQIYNCAWITPELKSALENDFPEIKESENEKVRKDIVAAVEMYKDFSQQRKEEIYAWLENQKPSFSHDVAIWDRGLNTGIEIGKKQKEPRDYRKLYEEVVKSDWFKENYKGKSLGEEQEPINQGNTHEPTVDEAREWREAYEKGYSLGYKNGRNEQKPAWSKVDEVRLDEAIEMIEAKGAWVRSDDAVKLVSDWLKSLPERFNIQPKSEWSEEDEKLLNYAISMTDDAQVKRFLKSLRPQPKQEWSEEDEKMLSWVIDDILNQDGNEDMKRDSQKEADWLKSLPERFVLQPKQEWSKKDEEILNVTIDMVTNSIYEPLGERDEMLAWLKSIKDRVHPKPEWSEEDEEMRLEGIRVLVSGCEKYRQESGCLPSWHKVIDWLKSLRPQSKQMISEDTEALMAKLVNLLKSYRIGEETATTLANRIADTYGTQRYLDGLCDGKNGEWKPTEEQMKHLERCFSRGHTVGLPNQHVLESLYNDLKKLM